ncbi:hypothetical protein VTL71DRAFT_6846 [Oculimacula yallundae]|uniref:Uncharacterized protein n=1 Tax=Oculimacula yallundae TaxID=86028 RepID=A0ABR4BV00_9HELO
MATAQPAPPSLPGPGPETLNRFAFREVAIEKLMSEVRELVTESTWKGVDEDLARRCEALRIQAIQMTEENLVHKQNEAEILVNKRRIKELTDLGAEKPAEDDAKWQEYLATRKEAAEEIADFWGTRGSVVPVGKLSSDAINRGLEIKIEKLEERLKEMKEEIEKEKARFDELEGKMQKIALNGGIMDEEEKKKYREKAGLAARMEARRPAWEAAKRGVHELLARQDPNSPYHISKLKKEGWATRAYEEGLAAREKAAEEKKAREEKEDREGGPSQ